MAADDPQTPGMHRAQPLPLIATACAERQVGILTRAQLAEFEVGDAQIARLCRQQVLHKVDRAVYQLGDHETGFPQYSWSAVLLGGRGARLLGPSAGFYEDLCPPSLPIVLGVPLTSGLGSRPWLRVVRERPGVRAARWIGAPARTLVEDTVLDLCAAARDEAEVVAVAHRLLGSAERLPRECGRPWIAAERLGNRRLIDSLVAEISAGVCSPLELRWIRNVEQPHGLPSRSGSTGCPRGRTRTAPTRSSRCCWSWTASGSTTAAVVSATGAATT